MQAEREHQLDDDLDDDDLDDDDLAGDDGFDDPEELDEFGDLDDADEDE